MKRIFLLLLFLIPILGFTQVISVDKDLYTPQELIEEVLVNSGCIENIEVTHVKGGNFSDGDKSYGYFENNGGSFPFAKGIVMSTGKLAHVPGPNNGLSDDNAPGWTGDEDLENYLDLNHTVNATVLEFDFTPNANNIRFRYIFASEEYRENQSSTCQYSDAFAFLIRPVGATQYENIAVVPGTDIPVKVTTVHSGIPGSCPPQNEAYFAGYNYEDSPIIFNGQTEILTAEAQVVSGQAYHIKLVIADDINYRFDSAVFLEGESFNIGADLGENITGLCEGESFLLETQEIGNEPLNYQWFKVNTNGSETLLAEGPDQDTYEGSEEGTYKVVLEYGEACLAEDEIIVSYIDFSNLDSLNISSCIPSDENPQGFIYDLLSFEGNILAGNSDFILGDFYISEADAEAAINPIENPENFHSTQAGQQIYVGISTERGCQTIREIILGSSGESLNPVELFACPDDNSSSQYTFSLPQAIPNIQDQLDTYIDYFEFYENESDAFYQENQLENMYSIHKNQLPHSVFVRIDGNLGCQGLVEIKLCGLEQAVQDPNYIPPAFCNGSTEPVEIFAGVIDDEDYLFEWETGETTPSIMVSEPGPYEVVISRPHEVNGEIIYCNLTKIIEVIESEKPQVSYRLIGEPGNYQIEITAEGEGDYQFALDEGNWKNQNIFEVDSGKHYFHVIDKNGCGMVTKEFYVIDYMKFFTPNGDGVNDFWYIRGDDPRNPQIKNTEIYDRYGKLIITLGPHDEWDGNFHGKPMPGNDYWFKINFKDGNVFKANFSLLR